MILSLLLLVGCPKPTTEARPPLIETHAVVPVPTGRVDQAVYVDSLYALSVAVPKGWVATPGSNGGDVRVVLQDPEGDLIVTIAGTRADTLAPRPLPGCTWTFTDAARYRAVKVRTEVMAATCTPDNPEHPRILAYMVAHEGMVWHVEGKITPGRLGPAKVDLDLAAGGIRFR